ncbi:HlyD family efflux transporter periplasmic adaptor subunit [Flavobacteriaceae bacterium]|nr:HlyD family efflux transporter periplasmic adaptor subunit [Flavobacteriaceae bacterium]
MKKSLIIISLAVFISCSNNTEVNNANGVFETTQVSLSAQTMGELLSFPAYEGMLIKKGQLLAQIDSTNLSMTKLQLESQIQGLKAQLPDIKTELSPIDQELIGLKKDQKRVKNMVESDAATQKQLDDINTRISVVESTYRSKKSSLTNLKTSLDFQINALDNQIDLLSYQIDNCSIKAPFDGTVLVKFAEANEVVGPGQPLMRVANLKEMTLRAYVTTEQLKDLAIGKKVTVFADYGKDGEKTLQGEISWISPSSEFTPKTIQTQDERANLVYAVKVKVKNNGLLRIGMYGGFNIE